MHYLHPPAVTSSVVRQSTTESESLNHLQYEWTDYFSNDKISCSVGIALNQHNTGHTYYRWHSVIHVHCTPSPRFLRKMFRHDPIEFTVSSQLENLIIWNTKVDIVLLSFWNASFFTLLILYPPHNIKPILL